MSSVDSFIVTDELCRCGSGGTSAKEAVHYTPAEQSLGVVWGLLGGLGIGLPPVIHFGSEEMKERVVAPVLRGEKRICLAISMSSILD